MSRRAWVEHIMGMPVSIHLRGPEVRGPEVEDAIAAAYDELRRIDELFSTYRPDSQLNRLRRGEIDSRHTDPLLVEVASLAREAHQLTEGAFTAMLPEADGVLRYDPTGLVKGWAVDRAAGALLGLPETAWSINAGGDILVGRHAHVGPTGADAAPWRIGIEDPHDRSRMAAVVPLVSGAVATSGTAARGGHLYDPFTGAAVSRPGSSTVVADTLLWADVWATALFVGGDVAREAFSRNASGYQSFAA